jgi:hypothetical protein
MTVEHKYAVNLIVKQNVNNEVNANIPTVNTVQ